MIKLAMSAILFATTATALAQTAPAPRVAPTPAPTPTPSMENVEPPPGFIAAAQAFGRCVGSKGQAAPATITPEAAAKQALAACATEKAALEGGFESWVSSPSFPAAGRAEARAQFRAQLDGLETQVANKFSEARAAAPTPVPAPTPTPTR